MRPVKAFTFGESASDRQSLFLNMALAVIGHSEGLSNQARSYAQNRKAPSYIKSAVAKLSIFDPWSKRDLWRAFDLYRRSILSLSYPILGLDFFRIISGYRGGVSDAFVHLRTHFPRHLHLLLFSKTAKSVTHVSGTDCHLCLRPFRLSGWCVSGKSALATN